MFLVFGRVAALACGIRNDIAGLDFVWQAKESLYFLIEGGLQVGGKVVVLDDDESDVVKGLAQGLNKTTPVLGVPSVKRRRSATTRFSIPLLRYENWRERRRSSTG
jgi:hypothetical protein